MYDLGYFRRKVGKSTFVSISANLASQKKPVHVQLPNFAESQGEGLPGIRPDPNCQLTHSGIIAKKPAAKFDSWYILCL